MRDLLLQAAGVLGILVAIGHGAVAELLVRRLNTAGYGAIGLIYYSGHGAADKGDKSGPYAAALAAELGHPGLDHLNLFQ